MIPVLAEAATSTSTGFSPVELVLGGVIIALCGVITKLSLKVQSLNDRIEVVQEDRRKTEVEAYKAILPLTQRVVEVIDELQPLISQIPPQGGKR